MIILFHTDCQGSNVSLVYDKGTFCYVIYSFKISCVHTKYDTCEKISISEMNSYLYNII